MGFRKMFSSLLGVPQSEPTYQVSTMTREAESNVLVCEIDSPVTPREGNLVLSFPDGKRHQGNGVATSVAPSRFLPSMPTLSDPYTYRLTISPENNASLTLCVTNWTLTLDIKPIILRGPECGTYHRIIHADSSAGLTRIKGEQKISLERETKLLHLTLVDRENQSVFEILGEELGFERQPRTSSPISYQSEVT